MSEGLLLVAIAAAALSGAPGLCMPRAALIGQRISVLLAALGSGLGLLGIAWFWVTGESRPVAWPWSLPGAEFRVAVDGLSALFLLPIFLVSLLGNIYGLDYWRQTEHPQNGRKLRLFYGLLTAGMALLVMGRNAIVFLFGWEIMALSAYFLVTTEDDDEEVRATGWIYFVATHVATLCLFALFGILRAATGSFDLTPLDKNSLSAGTKTAIFILALVGFGLKAGIMPLHVWLPSAHAIAPSHVSALMSGVIIKMGIYGLVRVLSLVPDPPLVWGGVVLGLGAVSGVLGVAFAVGQHDLKRLLAYHSIENIGIIVMGLGLALMGRAHGRADWVVLGLAGALLHVWNHALFKALLFLSAGSVIHAAHTRAIDRLGGLAKPMPRTALGFLVGAVAICGLPPLNGFVSELLIYLGLFSTLWDGEWPALVAAAFAAPALALIGALATACFVKVYGAVFLGSARSEAAQHAHESPTTMTGSMAALVACCVVIGLAPLLVAPVLGKAIVSWTPEYPDALERLNALAPLGWVSIMGFLLLAALLSAWALLRQRLQHTGAVTGVTWGCGYLAPTPRMQYTASSFGQMIVGLFAWALRPRVKTSTDPALFPRSASFHSEVPETVLDEAVLPSLRIGARMLSWFRIIQRGNVQTYLLYVFLTLIALLIWR